MNSLLLKVIRDKFANTFVFFDFFMLLPAYFSANISVNLCFSFPGIFSLSLRPLEYVVLPC